MSADGSAAFFLNGKLIGRYPSSSLDYLLNDFDGSANYLGRSQYSSDPFFKGYMDDVTFYGKALTANEVSHIYNN